MPAIQRRRSLFVMPIRLEPTLICAFALLLSSGSSARAAPEAAKPPVAAAAKAAPVAAPLATERAEAEAPLLKVGDDAPLFNGVLHNSLEAGRPNVDLSAMVGAEAEADGTKVVLLSFFATWCKPCKKELPLLVQLDAELRPRGLRVISVAIDKDEALWPEIARLVKEHKVSFPVVKDRYNLIARRFLGDKTSLPSVFLIGRDGLVKVVKQGYPDDAETFLRAEVEKALGTP